MCPYCDLAAQQPAVPYCDAWVNNEADYILSRLKQYKLHADDTPQAIRNIALEAMAAVHRAQALILEQRTIARQD